ncbi:F-box/FBD/LRR-repeat protein At5g22700-like [Lolium perenne]|uniref:F-box/FBD/LRR-repeat protein At5g22700-like n=1 Tax=Lolium perenne TaxID=4522 RepID=UPI0021F5646C|nr:putative F-box protein At1g49610 [Lolium perenne]
MSERLNDGENMGTAVDGGEDRIGALPGDLLRYLMSLLPSRDAVRTCVLAKRWRTLWKSVPALRVYDPESYGCAHGASTFVDELIRLRSPTPLNVCDFSSDVDDDANYDFHRADEAFRRMEPWIQYAVSCQVRVLRVRFPCRATNMTLISPHLKRLELCDIELEGCSLDFSSCEALEELEIINCHIFANISSRSLKNLNIRGFSFDFDTRIHIIAPNLITCRLAAASGLTPVLHTMPSLVTASISLRGACMDCCNCGNLSCGGCGGQTANNNSSLVLKSLSGATNLEVTISGRAMSIFRNNLKWGPMFSKLKTLLLSEWCVADDFAGLVYFLQHSPILESLTLQLDFGTHKKHLNKTDKSYNLREQSLLSKHLKIVKIICVTKEDARVCHVLEILHTHGVPSEQIDIQ